MSVMTIGELARRSGVPAKTIRYYESIRLLPTPERKNNGYRVYAHRTLNELRFAHRARTLGFSIKDVEALLTLWRDDKRASAGVKALAVRHIEQIERKITELESVAHFPAELSALASVITAVSPSLV